MRPEGVVLPAISQCMGLCNRGEQLSSEELVTKPAIIDVIERSSYDYAKPFCHDDPGSVYAVAEPLPGHHSCKAWAMNSGPLSIRRWVGAG